MRKVTDVLVLHYGITTAKAHQIVISAIRKLALTASQKEAEIAELKEQIAYWKTQAGIIETNIDRQIEQAKAEARKESQSVYEPYIKLLGDELNETVGIAATHGWKSTRYEEGVRCRKAIEKLESGKQLKESK